MLTSAYLYYFLVSCPVTHFVFRPDTCVFTSVHSQSLSQTGGNVTHSSEQFQREPPERADGQIHRALCPHYEQRNILLKLQRLVVELDQQNRFTNFQTLRKEEILLLKSDLDTRTKHSIWFRRIRTACYLHLKLSGNPTNRSELH